THGRGLLPLRADRSPGPAPGPPVDPRPAPQGPPGGGRLPERPGRPRKRHGSAAAMRCRAPLSVALVWLAARGGPPREQVETPAPVPVPLAPVRRGPLHRVVRVTGVVKPATGAELVVTAPQSARIAALPKGVGERVHKGDLLVRFDIPSLQADAA